MYKIKQKIRISKENILRPITSRLLKRRLLNDKFTIISSNCIGARIYQELGMEYNTPFVGLFIYAPCFIKLLSNLELFLSSELTFTNTSKYLTANTYRLNTNQYPIGLLREEVELHLIHYENEYEAQIKWTRRLTRMDMDNLFIIFTDRDVCEEKHLMEFDHLPFDHKVCFTANPMHSVKSSVAIREYIGLPYVDDLYNNFYILNRNFDYIDWLNGGTGRK